MMIAYTFIKSRKEKSMDIYINILAKSAAPVTENMQSRKQKLLSNVLNFDVNVSVKMIFVIVYH